MEAAFCPSRVLGCSRTRGVSRGAFRQRAAGVAANRQQPSSRSGKWRCPVYTRWVQRCQIAVHTWHADADVGRETGLKSTARNCRLPPFAAIAAISHRAGVSDTNHNSHSSVCRGAASVAQRSTASGRSWLYTHMHACLCRPTCRHHHIQQEPKQQQEATKHSKQPVGVDSATGHRQRQQQHTAHTGSACPCQAPPPRQTWGMVC